MSEESNENQQPNVTIQNATVQNLTVQKVSIKDKKIADKNDCCLKVCCEKWHIILFSVALPVAALCGAVITLCCLFISANNIGICIAGVVVSAAIAITCIICFTAIIIKIVLGRISACAMLQEKREERKAIKDALGREVRDIAQ